MCLTMLIEVYTNVFWSICWKTFNQFYITATTTAGESLGPAGKDRWDDEEAVWAGCQGTPHPHTSVHPHASMPPYIYMPPYLYTSICLHSSVHPRTSVHPHTSSTLILVTCIYWFIQNTPQYNNVYRNSLENLVNCQPLQKYPYTCTSVCTPSTEKTSIYI